MADSERLWDEKNAAMEAEWAKYPPPGKQAIKKDRDAFYERLIGDTQARQAKMEQIQNDMLARRFRPEIVAAIKNPPPEKLMGGRWAPCITPSIRI